MVGAIWLHGITGSAVNSCIWLDTCTSKATVSSIHSAMNAVQLYLRFSMSGTQNTTGTWSFNLSALNPVSAPQKILNVIGAMAEWMSTMDDKSLKQEKHFLKRKMTKVTHKSDEHNIFILDILRMLSHLRIHIPQEGLEPCECFWETETYIIKIIIHYDECENFKCTVKKKKKMTNLIQYKKSEQP